MKCGETLQKLILLAAVAVGIAVYALFSAAEIAALTALFPILAAVNALGLFGVLTASALGCGCNDNGAFCTSGILAVLGGAGGVIAALLTALAGADAGTAFRVGTAISFALTTLLLGGIAGLVADSNGCVSCGCSCGSDDGCGDSDAADRSFSRGAYYRR